MKKIVILGCENSHANVFLKFIKENKEYSDVEVVGVYSDDKEASKKLQDTFGVPVLENYDSAVGQVDGVIVTARHGDNHYKFVKPYISSGVPMFIDKPITVKEDEAVEFMRELKKYGNKITGGSCVKFDPFVLQVKEEVEKEENGKTLAGEVHAPVSMKNAYGNFFFYAQHLAEVLCEVYGRNPISVKATRVGEVVTVVFEYENYNIVGRFFNDMYASYYIARYTADKATAGQYFLTKEDICFKAEFEEYYNLLMNKTEQAVSYQDFIAPVFILNAIYRSLESGKMEKVVYQNV